MRTASRTATPTVIASSTIERTVDFVRWAPPRAMATGSSRGAGSSQASDPVGRPVGEEGLADDPGPANRAPEAAVLGIRAVVAHHVVHPARNDDGLGEVAVGLARAGHDVAVP